MQQLKPKVGTRAAIFLVVSVIIGSGVFKKIAPMSEQLGAPSLVILCWIAAGLISLAGALLMQGIWAILLVFSGAFDQLTDMLVFVAFIFMVHPS